ncbi:discoidin domain-containing protein, partial [Planktothrix tepida]|uniref:discoidin domain-containing protein n=1 Tax=Planktothrix tepida TaxID=1678309 RepID=UPI00278BBD8A
MINLLLQFERDLNTILIKFNDNISYHPNVALRKPTQQSSHSSHCNQLQSAVNGIKDGKFSFHTKLEVNPWWQVDLEGIYLLTEVQVYNRIDTCADRARTLRILLSSDGENWNLVYTNDENNIFGGVDGKPLVVAIASKLARYVRLQLNEETRLHLDEVEVYGEPVAISENLLNSFVNLNQHLDQKIVFH